MDSTAKFRLLRADVLDYALDVNTADGWSGWHQGPEENDVGFTVRKSVVDHMVFE